MKVVSTVVGRKSPENPKCNTYRYMTGYHALSNADSFSADLIVLPGGFFTAQDDKTRRDVAEHFAAEAKSVGIAVVFGVDEMSTTSVKGQTLPYYGYAWSPSEGKLHCWQQRSTNNQDQWFASEADCEEQRQLIVGTENVGVLMCGEIFNERIRNYLSKNQPIPKLAVVVAHIGRGFRVFQGMKKLAELGIASVCSVHAQSKNAMKYCYLPNKGSISSRESDEILNGVPRIELKVWEINAC